jgi:small subunit ribosomal protein S6
MAQDSIVYDLVLLLSLESEETARAKVLSEIEAAVSAAGGSLSRNQEWGRRPTTFRINHQSEAEYHLLQFTGPTSLLESLQHTLRIADEVLRFRIIKVIPGTPDPSDAAPPVVGAPSADGEAPVERQSIER